MPTPRRKLPSTSKDVEDAASVELRRVRDRELELKRARGQISCAECRQHKLKCDRKIPCSSCLRRGCQAICPTGLDGQSTSSMPTAPDVERLLRKITAMSERIRALEDALQIEYAARATGGSRAASHPLLSEELLAIKQDINDLGLSSPPEGNENDGDEPEIVDAFGTLSISEGRTMRFLGASATEQLLLMKVCEPSAPHHAFDFPTSSPQELHSDLSQASAMWPFTPMYLPRDVLATQIAAQLPEFDRATALYEAYFTNLGWNMAPIERKQVIEDLLPLFYPRHRAAAPGVVCAERLHDLALLLMVFACGAVADLTQPPINSEAERFHQLARAALGLQNVFDCGGSLSAVQALLLLGCYNIYAARKGSLEVSWKFISLGLCIAASIGLHRDPARWKLGPKVIRLRRRTFWIAYQLDIWKSLNTGRPPMFTPNVIDCEFPADENAILDEDGTEISGVLDWRYRFARDVLPHMVEKLCSASTVKYSDILELDRKVRNFDVPPYLTRPLPSNGLGVNDLRSQLHPLSTVWKKEKALICIHRNFFARAILEFPKDPLRSPFAPSFLATYRSATYLIRTIRENFGDVTHLMHRTWTLWAYALSSAVIVGSVAVLGPAISFAPSALVELELAIALFEKNSSNTIVNHSLPLLLRIREKALREFYESHTNQCSQVDGPALSEGIIAGQTRSTCLMTPSNESESADDELLILRGATRTVERCSVPHPPRPVHMPSYSQKSLPSITLPSSLSNVSTMPSSTNTSPAATAIGESEPSKYAAVPSPRKSSGAGVSLFWKMDGGYLHSPSMFVQEAADDEERRGPMGDSGRASHQPYSHSPSAAEEGQEIAKSRAHAPMAAATSQSTPDLRSQLFQQHQLWPWPSTTHVGAEYDTFADEMEDVGIDPSLLNLQAFTESNPASASAAEALMSLPVSFNPSVDQEMLYQDEEAVAAEAWNTFMQQTGLADPDLGWDGWGSVGFI